ncbi:unnamed protein product, partial [Effrenium voratum]
SKSVLFQAPGRSRPCSMLPAPAGPTPRPGVWKQGEQMMNIAASLFSWGLGWQRILLNARRLQDGYDIKYSAPLAVLLLGVVMTNILGVLDFLHEGHRLSVAMAAVDLDTPYLAAARCPQLLRGEPASDWERLRIRNAIWRSVPLASISFYIALRDLLEIPSCQLVASQSIIANGFTGIPNMFSEAASAGENPLNFQKVYRWNQINASVRELHLERYMNPKLWERWRRTEAMLWRSAHCEDSKWSAGRKLYLEDLAETWFVQPVVRLEDGHTGGLGTGNLLMTNILFQQAALRHLSLQKSLKPDILKLIRRSKGMVSREYVGVAWMSLEDTVNAFEEKLRKDLLDMPGVKTADVFSIHQERERWQWNLGFSFILLLHAVSPMVKHVQKSRRIPSKKLLPIAVHCMLDMILLVATLIGASLAEMAHDAGA